MEKERALLRRWPGNGQGFGHRMRRRRRRVLHEVDRQRRYFVRGLGCWGFRLLWVWAVGIRQGCSLSPAGVANLHASVHVHILMYLHARIHMHTPTHI